MSDQILESAETMQAQLQKTRAAARSLAQMTAEQRNSLLRKAADEIERHASEILSANDQDCAALAPAVASGQVSQALADRLRTSNQGIQEMAARVRDVARLDDPLARTLATTELDDNLTLYKTPCPLGVIAVVFESRPDVVPQIGSLAIKTGNGLALKGGVEARWTNRQLVGIWHDVLAARSPELKDAVRLFEDRADVMRLLQLEREIDLVVPRGSTEFVNFVFQNSRIPVLGHGSGICHIYVDAAADLAMTTRIVVDAKVQYPAACNSVEKVLVHQAVAAEFLPGIVHALQSAAVEVIACERTRRLCPDLMLTPAREEDWNTEYGDLKITIKVVDDLASAIAHIDRYGSRHTECIVTEDHEAAEFFMHQVDAASVFHNASTRFADGFRYGLGAEVGISNSKLHARGPVGMEGLLTYKYILRGSGQVVADYAAGRRKFTHRKIE